MGGLASIPSPVAPAPVVPELPPNASQTESSLASIARANTFPCFWAEPHMEAFVLRQLSDPVRLRCEANLSQWAWWQCTGLPVLTFRLNEHSVEECVVRAAP